MVEWKLAQKNGMMQRLKASLSILEHIELSWLLPQLLLSLRFVIYVLLHQNFVGLKKLKEQYESELEELGSIREMQLKESEASGRISGLEKKIQYAEIEKVFFILHFMICS